MRVSKHEPAHSVVIVGLLAQPALIFRVGLPVSTEVRASQPLR